MADSVAVIAGGTTTITALEHTDSDNETIAISAEPIDAIYSECYGSYRSWALQSIDILKGELLSLCFPLFVFW